MKKERREIELFEKEAKLLWFGQDKAILERLDKLILPFQTAESLAIDRPARGADLWHETYQKEKSEWRNRLIWGDNLYVLASLLPEFRGKVDLIYIDPPFATGADFSLKVKLNGDELKKLPSAVEMKAYSDTWAGGIASYLQWLYERLVLMKELLAETGSIYVHLDWRVEHYVKVMMDEVFGNENFVNEIVWVYKTGGISEKWFARKHNIILMYARDDTHRKFNPLTEMSFLSHKYGFSNIEIKKAPCPFVHEGKTPLALYTEVGMRDVWDIPALRGNQPEIVSYITQKPEEILNRVILASSNPGDLVLDAFCGSGTTCAVAEKLGRRWIGIDIGRFAIHTTRKRLLQIEKEDPERGKIPCSPFVIQNLGVYERQAWLSVLSPKAKPEQIADYIRFVLEAYEARPLLSEQGIHGVKEGKAVMIGPVDRAVSWNEAMLALKSAKSAGYSELDILAWEWDMELNERFKDQAKEQGVKVRLIAIPRELIDGERDIKFVELAYISAEAKVSGRKVQVHLKGFAHPNPEWLTDEIREKLGDIEGEAWTKLVDYWACDFDYKMDTFHNGFCAYRTKKNKNLPLVSETHEYDHAGEYTILLKVIDIFGIENTKALKVRVK